MNNEQMTCDPGRIESFLQQQLSADEQSSFESHLDSCDECRDRLEATAAPADVWSGIRESLRGEGVMTLKQHTSEVTRASTDVEDSPFGHDAVLDLLAPTDDDRMLGRLGSYEVMGVVGSGGMGVVLKALDPSLNRHVAIKILAPHHGNCGAARKRFSREAQAAAAVVHDNVVEIYGVADTNGLPWLVMPYLPGPSLQKRLDDEGPLTLVEILRIGAQAASGLAAAHAQGLVHRDVKPANILLSDGIERVKLTDFGLARAADDASITKSGTIAGTPQYMSPEQARGDAVDQRSDLFSLGSVLYALCTGRAPFRAETSYGVLRRITDEDARPIREINPEIPEWLCSLIDRLMAKRASDRVQSADEVAVLLQQCLAHVQQPTAVPLPIIGPPPSGSDATSSRRIETAGGSSRRLTGILAWCCAIAFTGAGAFGLLYWMYGGPPDISGRWAGQEWGLVELEQTKSGEYDGTYTDTFGRKPGRIGLKWSAREQRFKGTWREGEDRFGTIAVRLLDGEIRGAWTTNDDARINPGIPELSDLRWARVNRRTSEPGIVGDLDGQVLALLSNEDVLISIGHDDGITARTKLIVFRDQDFRGRLEVVHVQADRSVARITESMSDSPIRRGDHVASEGIPFQRVSNWRGALSLQIQGAWQLVHQVMPDGDVTATPRQSTWTFDKGYVVCLDSADRMIATWTVNEAESPAHFDLQSDGRGTPARGVVEIENDRLKICLADRDQLDAPRPEACEPTPGYWYMEFMRPGVAAEQTIRPSVPHAITPPQTDAALTVEPAEVPATIEFRFAFSEPADGLEEFSIEAEDEKLYVAKDVVVTSDHIQSVKAIAGPDGRPSIEVTLREDFAAAFGDLTEKNIGTRLAIIVNGKLLSAPAIRARISDKALITGNFTPEFARRIAMALNPTPMTTDRLSVNFSIETIAWSADGNLFAVANGNPTRILLASGGSRFQDDWTPAVKVLAADSGEEIVSLTLSTDTEDEVLEATTRVSGFVVTALEFSPDGRHLAVGTSIGQLKLYDSRTGALVRSFDDTESRLADPETPDNWASLKRAIGSVKAATFSPDGTYLAVCGPSFGDFSDVFDGIQRLGERGTGPGRLKVWEVSSGVLEQDLAGHSDANAVTYAPNGKLLASTGRWVGPNRSNSGDGVILWDTETAKIVRQLTHEHNGGTHSVAISPDSRLIAYGSVDFDKDKDRDAATGYVSLARSGSGILEWRRSFSGWATPLGFSFEGHHLLVRTGGNDVSVLNAETGEVVQELKASDDPKSGRWKDFAVSPTAGLLAIGATDADGNGSIELRKLGE